jgi:polysaccharide export outer membrane protein
MPHKEKNKAGPQVMGFPEYVIGPNDSLTITLWLKSKAEVTQSLVRPDGRISFLFVEDMQVAGLTPTQIDQELTKRLQGYVKDPKLDILVSKFDSKKVSLFGEIERLATGVSGPGVYPLSGETTILRLILSAGGYSDRADLKNVEITRMGKVYKVDLTRTLYMGDQSQNIILEGGDSVVIPELPQYREEKLLPRKVFVLGEVLSPGLKTFKNEIRVIEAVSLAGGIKKEANEALARILRGEEEIAVNIKKILAESQSELNIKIKDGDILYIPMLPEFEDERRYSNRIYVSGGVNKEGLFTFKKKIGAMEVVTMAGGFSRDAYQEDTYIIRQGIKLPVHVTKYLSTQDTSLNVEVQDGDILYVPRYDLMLVSVYGEAKAQGQYEIKGRNILLSDAIAKAGGYTEDAVLSDIVVLRGDMRKPKILRTDFEKFFKKKDLSQNVKLEEGDVVYIPRSKIASISHFMTKVAPILANLMYPGLYRDMYTTGGGMRFDTGFPPQTPSSTSFPQVAP